MRETIKSLAVGFFRRAMFNDRLMSYALAGRLVRNFADSPYGLEYGVTRAHRKSLVSSFQRINRGIRSATHWPTYIVLAQKLLNIARSMPGDVVECGCFKGASTSALSLLCSLTGRKLIVCDSFQGLPADCPDAKHEYPHLGVSTSYTAGEFKGNLAEVKTNIERYGDISACEFVPGFFSESLRNFRRPLVFAFLDVDLRSSMEDCIRNLWPSLQDGGAIFTDDSCDMEVVKIWFDKEFWNQELNCQPPGYIGSGCGIPSLSPKYSSLGYTIKGAQNYTPTSFT